MKMTTNSFIGITWKGKGYFDRLGCFKKESSKDINYSLKELMKMTTNSSIGITWNEISKFYSLNYDQQCEEI